MEKLINEFSIGLFFWQMLLFLVLLFLLGKYAWKPILNVVNKRKSSIEEALNSAKKAREEMERLWVDNEKILKKARRERDAILKEARDIKDKTTSEAKEKAHAEGSKLVEQAKAEIESQKIAAVIDLKNQIAEMSIEIAEKVLCRELSSPNKQEELVQEQLKDFKLS